MKYLPYGSLVTWPVLLSSVAAYATLVITLYLARRNAAALTLRVPMLAYNAAQVLLCGWMTAGFAGAALQFPNVFGINTAYTPSVEMWMFVHFLSKYLDFGDTIFMLLKKNYRQLSFLHLFHHSSILVVWGYLLQVGHANGTAYFGAAINSFVHTVMYSHYLWTALGFNNPFKRYVTTLQMVQFFACLAHALCVVLWEQVLPARLGYLQLTYHIIMVILFSDFQRRTYRDKGDKTL